VACEPETCFTPRGDEFVRLVPAVEADTERVASQHTEDFSERGFQPRGIVIIGYCAAVTGTIVREIWRIGQDEIDAAAV